MVQRSIDLRQMNHGFYKVQLTLMASTAQLLNCWKLKWRKLVALLKGHWRSTAKRTGCIGEKSRGTAYGRFEAIRGQLARRTADIGRALPKPSVLKLDGYLDRRLMADCCPIPNPFSRHSAQRLLSQALTGSPRPNADVRSPFAGGLLASRKRSLTIGKGFHKILLAGNPSEKLVTPSAEHTLTVPLCARAMDLVIANPSPEPSPVRCRDESTR